MAVQYHFLSVTVEVAAVVTASKLQLLLWCMADAVQECWQASRTISTHGTGKLGNAAV